jgi:hypothetical protein
MPPEFLRPEAEVPILGRERIRCMIAQQHQLACRIAGEGLEDRRSILAGGV